MNDAVSFTAQKAVLDKLVSNAYPFTAQGSGDPHHLRCLLIDARSEDGSLTLTGESQHSAFRQSTSNVTIDKPGLVQVQAAWLNTALSVIQPDQDVTITYDGRYLHVTSPSGHVNLATAPINDSSLVAEIGEYDTSQGIVLSPEDFVTAYEIASSSRDTTGSYPLLRGVFAEVTNGELRLISNNRISTSTYSVPVEVVGEGIQQFILHHESISPVLSHMKEGNKVSIYSDSSGLRRVHILVHGKEGVQLYHIRLSLLDHDPNEYPNTKMRKGIQNIIQSTTNHLRVDKMELLRVLDNSSRICLLDPSGTGGQNKNVHVGLGKEGATVQVSGNGEAQYEEVVPVSYWTSDKVSQFLFKQGLYGHMIRAYPGRNDLTFALADKNDGETPYAIVLYESDTKNEENSIGTNGLDSENLPGYICIVQIAEGKYVDHITSIYD